MEKKGGLSFFLRLWIFCNISSAIGGANDSTASQLVVPFFPVEKGPQCHTADTPSKQGFFAVDWHLSKKATVFANHEKSPRFSSELM